MLLRPTHTAFSNLICYIISLRPDKKMFWINAFSIITMMTDASAMMSRKIGDFSIVQFIANSMGCFKKRTPYSKNAITIIPNTSLPFPALIWRVFLNKWPKSLSNYLRGYLNFKSASLASDGAKSCVLIAIWRDIEIFIAIIASFVYSYFLRSASALYRAKLSSGSFIEKYLRTYRANFSNHTMSLIR